MKTLSLEQVIKMQERTILLHGGSHDDIIDFILGIASGDGNIASISNWLKTNTIK